MSGDCRTAPTKDRSRLSTDRSVVCLDLYLYFSRPNPDGRLAVSGCYIIVVVVSRPFEQHNISRGSCVRHDQLTIHWLARMNQILCLNNLILHRTFRTGVSYDTLTTTEIVDYQPKVSQPGSGRF